MNAGWYHAGQNNGKEARQRADLFQKQFIYHPVRMLSQLQTESPGAGLERQGMSEPEA
jgi:hypothetical protein